MRRRGMLKKHELSLLIILWGLAPLQSIHRIVRSTGTAVRYRYAGHRCAQATGANRFKYFGVVLCLLLLVAGAQTPVAAQTLAAAPACPDGSTKTCLNLDEVKNIFLKRVLSYKDRLKGLFKYDPFCKAKIAIAINPKETVFKRRDAFRDVLHCIKNYRVDSLQEDAANTVTGDLENRRNEFVAFSGILEQTEAEFTRYKAASDFMGLTWGVGFGYSFADDDVIEEAVNVNGVVRSKKNATRQARIIL